MANKKYYLGLDIGTDSVGYAVSDTAYNLLKHKGEPMWGVHLFDAAQLNDERRNFRTARRRLDRKQQRVKLVQQIFANEIANVDVHFYRRIQESSLWREDAKEAYTLFNDPTFKDKDYHQQYPTIHHLICELMHNKAPHDVRLVYLACVWLVAHRGHFLSEVSKDNIAGVLDFQKIYDEFINFFDDNLPWKCDKTAFANVLKKKSGINAKYKELCLLLFGKPKAPKNEQSDNGTFYSKEAMLKLLCGGKASAKELFGNEEYADIDSFSLDKGDEELSPILSAIGDDAELILRLKALYDWTILTDVLAGEEEISKAKIKVYENHEKDLRLLKQIVRKYLPKKYDQIFRDKKQNLCNYAAYIKKSETTASQEDFCKFLKTALSSLQVEESDKDNFDFIMNRINANMLCPKQVNSDNRVIPHQVYWVELKKIVENASAYLPFLNEADADGYAAKGKLLSIFEFRVPYFVGPLNRASKDFSWFSRKAEGKIYPWNFEKLIDFDKSEQEFIDRMTNTCTFLPFASVLPKCSLLNEKFQVLNEINTLTVNGVKIPVDVKQQLYNEYFMSHKKVTKKAIKDFLLSNNHYTKEELDTLSGIDDTVKSSLSSHIAFRNLLHSGRLSYDNVEEIIKRATYTESKTRFRKWIDEKYSFLSEDDRRYISNLKCKDFARLSKELLCELYEEPNEQTGEVISIIDRMWHENINLNELLSDRYTYKKQIVKCNEEYYREHPRSIDERMNEMRISNSVKRSILRTLAVISDVVKVNGAAPEKIFIEMARGGKPEDKGKRSKSRYQQLKELFTKCDLEEARLMSEMLDHMGDDRDNRLQNEKLFLYYLQLGKSIYSGKTIDIEHLADQKLYDIDHIYPQSKVKDDSVLNNKVLVLSEENGQKSNNYPIKAEIRNRMSSWWKLLRDNAFITEEKYKRLVRHTPFDENEEWGFINRQLVETRQSTKAVATLLKEKWPDTEIVYVKAGLVSEFRQEFDLLKSRAVNDMHHAKDAYLNIVVGNVYHEKFTRKWFSEHRDDYNLKVKTLFGHPVKLYTGKVIWQGGKSINQVKNIVHNKHAIHFTKYAFCRKGGFFDMQPVKAKKGLVPLKKGLPTEKYGGYNKPTASFFIMTKYSAGKKAEIMLMPVELLYAKPFLSDHAFAEQYAKENIAKITNKSIDSADFPLGMRKIKINTLLELDGMRMSINGKSNGGKCLIVSLCEPLIVGYRWERYIKCIERFVEKKKQHPSLVYSEKYDGISKDNNIVLYDQLTEKLRCNIYSKRPANPAQILISGREKFVLAEIDEQAKCLLQIISVFGRNAGGCDLQTVGGAPHAASTGNFSSSLSNWKKNYSSAYIIDQSPSGLFEKRSENLLALL
ncbi:MAG: type II CRISPR RNA-guided endonuclease Cas9 [Clostridiales bacterium]|nr:type II CRISPR RNA-guided endonuclease Cas9 [Clostridiales bacterium]